MKKITGGGLWPEPLVTIRMLLAAATIR
ncbi:MAG: hypothetical protein RL077_4530, partial [Verrucomicrobiota bacterium]